MWIYGSRRGWVFMITLGQDPGRKVRSRERCRMCQTWVVSWIMVLKWHSPVSGDASDRLVSVKIVVSGPGPPELGDTLGRRTSLRTLIRDPGNPSRGPGVCWQDQSF